jgi:hypothetical protein
MPSVGFRVLRANERRWLSYLRMYPQKALDKEMSDDGSDFIDLMDEIEELEGTQLSNDLDHLFDSIYTLTINYDVLQDAIKSYENDWQIWAVENRDRLESFQIEFTRRLHNYLSSVFSLLEHTYAFKNSLDNEKFNKRYSEQLEASDLSDKVTFLKDLRNYTQHYKLPFVTATLSYQATDIESGEGEIEQTLSLNQEPLLEWDGWNSDSRAYLEELDDEIDIGAVAEDYQEAIIDFYDWFRECIEDIYSDEFEEREDMVNKAQELAEQLYGDDISIQTEQDRIESKSSTMDSIPDRSLRRDEIRKFGRDDDIDTVGIIATPDGIESHPGNSSDRSALVEAFYISFSGTIHVVERIINGWQKIGSFEPNDLTEEQRHTRAVEIYEQHRSQSM